ncbi:hypothetical protein R4I43_25680 [Saccharopolyspora sp. S2-29]|uniref:Uncharacterized protein n=1 Tax=Saccharopolyspora mangrovi TaxID=3082379 RepID=A0ABU6AH78_9PSEU|nr:hypothetical protein [Saccharopolyspora sp. S2-29]MEB3370798.1 hypothetical protein [Saccharopolyspora sp. S2-29]
MQRLVLRQSALPTGDRVVHPAQRGRQSRLVQHRLGEQRKPHPAPGGVGQHVTDQLRGDVHDQVGEAAVVRRVPVVRVLRVERHHHALRAGALSAPAAEGLRADLGAAERVRLVGVQVVAVVFEVRAHHLHRHSRRAPVGDPLLAHAPIVPAPPER